MQGSKLSKPKPSRPEPSTREREVFEQSASRFYGLIHEEEEWDLFCSTNALDQNLVKTKFNAEKRDDFFWALLVVLRFFRRLRQRLGWRRLLSSHKWPIEKFRSRRKYKGIAPWIQRLADWQRHLDVYFKLHNNAATSVAAGHGTERLQYLSDRLPPWTRNSACCLRLMGRYLGS